MRYKDVFLIWLFADLLLAAGVFVFSLISNQLTEGDFGMVPLLIFFGLLFSLPSLIAMLIFHAAYSTNKISTSYRLPYLLLILAVNLLYWLVGVFIYTIKGIDYLYFILCTTFCGILALIWVDRNIQKRLQQQKLSEAIDNNDLIS